MLQNVDSLDLVISNNQRTNTDDQQLTSFISKKSVKNLQPEATFDPFNHSVRKASYNF